MNKLLALARTKLGCGYVWGCQGEILTPQLLNTLKNKYGAQHYELGNGVSASKWVGSQVFDCSGLIVWCLNELGFIAAGQD
ncbi:MAG TPA: peptidoglycan endopeptidase, partial [Clostridia bacterium]